MTTNIEKYMKERVDDQYGWFEKKSSRNQLWYKLLNFSVIALTAVMPLAIVYCPCLAKWASAACAVMLGAVNFFKFEEKWKIYRATAETIKRERLLFINEAGKYKEGNADELFIEIIESIIAESNSDWKRCVFKNDRQGIHDIDKGLLTQ